MRDLGARSVRNDIALYERDLEAIENTIYEAKKEELVARSIIDVETSYDPGAETIGYDMLSESGAAKVTSNGADDIPLVDGDLNRQTQKIVTIEDGFKVTTQERRNAEYANRPIRTQKAATARRVIAERENEITFVGDSELGVPGLVNASNINTYDVPTDSDSDGTLWEYKTGFEIIDDIREARKKVNTQPGFNADTLVLPSEQYQRLQEPVNQYNTNTVMSYIEDMGWFDNIVETNYLEEADPDGSNDVGLVIDTDPSNVQLALPMDIMMHDPITLDNNDVRVNLEERFAGIVLRYPLAVCRFDAI